MSGDLVNTHTHTERERERERGREREREREIHRQTAFDRLYYWLSYLS